MTYIIHIVPDALTTPTYNTHSTSIQLYPNPTETKFHISAIDRTSILQLVDIHGRICLTQNLEVQDQPQIIDIDILPKGIYWCILKNIDGQTWWSSKVLKW